MNFGAECEARRNASSDGARTDSLGMTTGVVTAVATELTLGFGATSSDPS